MCVNQAYSVKVTSADVGSVTEADVGCAAARAVAMALITELS
ncbi:MAG: hypothetical protein ACKESB_00955 [Candidatus Hodgkinia cicadicola]